MKRGMIAMSAMLCMNLYGSEYLNLGDAWENSVEFSKYVELIKNQKFYEAMKVKIDFLDKKTPEYLKDYLSDFKPELKDEYLGYVNLLPLELKDLLKELHKKSKKYIDSSDTQQKHQFVKHLCHFITSYKEQDGKTTKKLHHLIKFVPQIKNANFIAILEDMAKKADIEASKTPEQKQKEYEDFMKETKQRIEATEKRIEATEKRIEAEKKEILIWKEIIRDLEALPDVKLPKK